MEKGGGLGGYKEMLEKGRRVGRGGGVLDEY